MLRYRMGAGVGRVTILVIALLVFIVILGFGQIFINTPRSSSMPASTGYVLAPTFEERLMLWWEDGKAAGKRLWEMLTRQDAALDAGLPALTPGGAGDDEPEIVNNSSDITIEALDIQKPVSFVPLGSIPQVLIYSTHTHEAYAKTNGEDYVEAAKWRTTNNDYNIVRVGDALSAELAAKFGIAVIHDKSDSEVPVLATAYDRSLRIVQKNMEQYKDLKIIIDLHRDAFNASISPNTVTINSVKAARVMFVIGTGEGKTGVGFSLRPDWKVNLALAQAVNDNLKKLDTQLSRDISIKTGRYNQHLSSGAILIEVGNNMNTLDEVLATVPFLAQAIADALDKMPSTPLTLLTPSATPVATTTPFTSAPSNTPLPVIIETNSFTASPTTSPSPSPAWTHKPN